MKKVLLTFVFAIALLCGGALVTSAKDTSPSAKSVAISKGVLVAKTVSNKIVTVKARCNTDDSGCLMEFAALLAANELYEATCDDDYTNCSSAAASAVQMAGNVYEACLAR